MCEKWLVLAGLILASVLAAAPNAGDRQLKLSRFMHHGENESVELFCGAGAATCRLVRRRNGYTAAEVTLPSKLANAMLGSFLELIPARPQRRTAGQREMLLGWDVQWLGQHVEGRLDREERSPDEAYVDAVLSLEGALLAQFYGRNR